MSIFLTEEQRRNEINTQDFWTRERLINRMIKLERTIIDIVQEYPEPNKDEILNRLNKVI